MVVVTLWSGAVTRKRELPVGLSVTGIEVEVVLGGRACSWFPPDAAPVLLDIAAVCG